MSTARKFAGVRIDIESRSGEDIRVGVYRYAEDPDFRALVISYCPIYVYPDGSEKYGQVRTLNQNVDRDVQTFKRILQDPTKIKAAYNAQFERVSLSRWMGMPTGQYLDPANWRCSAILANVHGVFGTLDEVARALRSPITKDSEGRRLIRLFSLPMSQRDQNAADKTCGCQRFHDPKVHVEDFNKFVAYCEQDVKTEAVVAHLLPQMPEALQAEYEADQRINDRGVRHFKGLSTQAVAQVEVEKTRLMGELKNLTGLENPNSVQQMKGWLDTQGYPMTSLDKAHRAEAMDDPMCPDEVIEALTLKGAASLSSVAKHKAALDTRCSDGRIRGMLRYYAAHTGRFGGRGFQPQNIPTQEASRLDRLRLLHGKAGKDAPEIAKGVARASLVPAKGCVFVTFDYNAIEARVVGWLAGEKWMNDEFSGDGKIYEATAQTLFHENKAKIISDRIACGECGTCRACITRKKAKVASLALNYRGGAGALVNMGAESAGIDIGNYRELNAEWVEAGRPGKFYEFERDRHDYEELLAIRDVYRNASPSLVSFWKLLEGSWDRACLQRRSLQFGVNNSLEMVRDGYHNRLVLPSGRSIWYRNAASHVDKKHPDKVERRTFLSKAPGAGHFRQDIHSGLMCNNATQGTARDVMMDLLMQIESMTAKGWPGRTVLHVHDEVVLEVKEKHAQRVFDDVGALMDEPPDWAPGLAVKGNGSIMERYGK